MYTRIHIYIICYSWGRYLFSMINYLQASSMIDSQFSMEQLLKPENSLRTTGLWCAPQPPQPTCRSSFL